MWPRQMRTQRIFSQPKPPSSSFPSPTPPLFAWIMLGSVPCLRVPGPSVAGGVLAQLWWALRSHHSIESWPVVQDSDATPGSCPLAGVARSAFVQAGPGPAGAHGTTAGHRLAGRSPGPGYSGAHRSSEPCSARLNWHCFLLLLFFVSLVAHNRGAIGGDRDTACRMPVRQRQRRRRRSGSRSESQS